jgi:hypothetical protein
LQAFWLSYKRVQPAGQIHEYERVRMRFASTRFGRPDTLRCIWKRSHSFASASAYRLWHPEAAVASFRDMVKRQILARMTRDRQHSLTPTGNFACPAFLSLRCKRHPTIAFTAAHPLPRTHGSALTTHSTDCPTALTAAHLLPRTLTSLLNSRQSNKTMSAKLKSEYAA